MATANLKTGKAVITLKMGPKEARAVADVLISVGGSPVDSARGHIDNVTAALTAAGVKSYFTENTPHPFSGGNTSLYFKDGTK